MFRTIHIIIGFYFVHVLSHNNYNAFNATLTDIKLCKGPKHKECTLLKASIKSRNSLLYDFNVTQNVALTKGKLIALSNGKEYIRFHMKKPCEHLFIKPLFYSFYNITKNCVILKGQYKFSVDIEKLTQAYYGGSFYLGKWTFISMFYNDECNFYCVDISLTLY